MLLSPASPLPLLLPRIVSYYTFRPPGIAGVRERQMRGERTCKHTNPSFSANPPFSKLKFPFFCVRSFVWGAGSFFSLVGFASQAGGHLREPGHVSRGGPDRHRARVGSQAVRRRQGAGQPTERHGGPAQGCLVPLHEQGVRPGRCGQQLQHVTFSVLIIPSLFRPCVTTARCVLCNSACASCSWGVCCVSVEAAGNDRCIIDRPGSVAKLSSTITLFWQWPPPFAARPKNKIQTSAIGSSMSYVLFG